MACKQCGGVALMGKCSRCKIIKMNQRRRERPRRPAVVIIRESRPLPSVTFKPLKLELVEEPAAPVRESVVEVALVQVPQEDLREAARRLRATAITGRSRSIQP